MTYRHPNRQKASYRALVRWFGSTRLTELAETLRSRPSYPVIYGGRAPAPKS